jgi:DNA-binding GntR family transcriptional regulator
MHTYDHVYRALRKAVATGTIPAGTRLVETELAERLGVSRTPVRDALRHLESEGFAERGHGGGLWARPLDLDSMESLFLVRADLDALAARLACERAKTEEWQEARGLIEAIEHAASTEGPSSDAFSEAHLAFHTTIYRLAFGARFAGFLANHLLQYLEIAADLSYREPAYTLPAMDQHEHLLAEMASGDTERAVAAAQAHVRRSEQDARQAAADNDEA